LRADDGVGAERRRAFAVAAALFLLLTSVYLASYSGVPYVSDELGLAASVEGLVKWGEATLGQLSWFGYEPGIFEPGQVLAAAPLYWIALHLPGVGLLQGLYLFNVFVTAATGVLVFLYVRRLGYGHAVGAVAGLAYGLGTNAWVYSKTFFREPLASLFVLAAAYCLLALRPAPLATRRVRYWATQAALAGLALGAAVATKESSAILVPIFVVYALIYLAASVRTSSLAAGRWLRVGLLLALGLSLALGALVLYNWTTLQSASLGLRNVLARVPEGITLNPEQAQALLDMPFNPGKGLFTHAPILLAAFISPFLVSRRRALADLALPWLVTFGIMWLYAHAWPQIWWGGRTWGARYLVPALPFLACALAPVIERTLRSRRWATVAWGALFAVSMAVQSGGVAVGLEAYARTLLTIREDAAWTLAIYDPAYSEIIGHLRILSPENLDFAWYQMWDGVAQTHFGLLATLLAMIISGVLALRLTLRRELGRRALMAFAASAVVAPLILSWVSLVAYYDDPRYRREPEWFSLLNTVADSARPGDALIVNAPTHTEFALNYNRASIPWYGLNKETSLPARQKDLTEITARYRRVWLATEFPAASDEYRGVEAWLSTRAYRLGETQFGYPARLTLFSIPSPTQRQPDLPALQPLATFEPALGLLGARFANAAAQAGEPITVTLYWRALSAPDGDYTMSVQLWDQTGVLRAQSDAQPADGLRPTSGWQAGENFTDYRSLALPPGLPAGTYRLVVAVYRQPDSRRLPLRAPEGMLTAEPNVLLLGGIGVGQAPPAVLPYPVLQ
jgi:hypothetical protein